MDIKFKKTGKVLSSFGGIVIADKLYKNIGIAEEIVSYLPKQKRQRGTSGEEKFRAMVLSFIAGGECLEDIENFKNDEGFLKVAKHVNAAQTYGDFLRGFDTEQIRNLNQALINIALKSRKACGLSKDEFILDIDSTIHIQHGKKMEGLGYDYDNNFGLTSLEVFDQYGFQYSMEVRSGNTYTSEGSLECLESIFQRTPSFKKRYLRADSGYCNQSIFNLCEAHNISYVIKFKGNMRNTCLKRVTEWKKSEKLKFYDGRDCEIATTYYATKDFNVWNRVIIQRAEKLVKENQEGCVEEKEKYDYCSWITNIKTTEKTAEEVILFYRKRGNAENFIRELKNGLDLKHFPCLKLNANKAYGIIAAFAHNILRHLSYTDRKTKVHYSKAIRAKIINIPVIIVTTTRDILFKFSEHVYDRVMLFCKRIDEQFKVPRPHPS
jgi:hypothetical protein